MIQNIPISMLLHLLRLFAIHALPKPHVQIRTCAEDAPIACYYDAFYAVVNVEHGVCRLNLLAHCVGEGIVFVWAVEREDDYAGGGWVVGGADLGEGEGVVGFWERDWLVGHCSVSIGWGMGMQWVMF